MKNKNFLKTLALLSLLLLIPFSLNAFGENKEIIKGNIYKMGDTIEITQEVDGDVMAMAQTLKINSPVKGDVLAIAENLEINADIEGDLRVACKNITINAQVARNVNILAGDIEIKEHAIIGKDLLLLSGNFIDKGKIKGNINGIAENIELGNFIEGNVNMTLIGNEKLIIAPNANIKGMLNYTSSRQAEIDKTAAVAGGVKQIVPKKKEAKPLGAFGKIISLFSMIAVGMVAIMIDKKNTMRTVNSIMKNPAKNLAFGILYFIIAPILVVILMLTIIGFPMALILLALYLILIYAGQVFSGIALGYILLNKKINNDIWKMIIGLLLMIMLTSLPYIGTSIKLISILLGMGAIVNMKREMLKETNK